MKQPFSDRMRYKFHVTVANEKCYRVISVPRSCSLSELTYTALRSLHFDSDNDFDMEIANHPEIDCIPEMEVSELQLYDGDVIELTYDNWLISLLLLYNDELDHRQGTALLKASGDSPNQEDKPSDRQKFPKNKAKKKKRKSKEKPRKKRRIEKEPTTEKTIIEV